MESIADPQAVGGLIDGLADQIAAGMRADNRWAIVGIRRRGDVLARRLADRLQPSDTGSVDIALYRDDLSEVGPQPIVRTTEIDFDVAGRSIVLVDDVLMSGRSVRAAIQSLLDFGRPRTIRLAVLVDRGGRELPICPDYVGLAVHADASQHVRVRLEPMDDEDRILLMDKPEAAGEA
jgi:pyrimidine operon attenuation protein/uracil phosphoribosyltransferase